MEIRSTRTKDHELIREYRMMHQWDLGNESWKLEWIILRSWAPENQTEKTPELLRIGGKNSLNWKQLWEDGIKLELRIFGRMGKDLRGTLLRSSKSENYDEKHHQIVEILRNKVEWKSWTNDENNLKDLGEKHLTDEKFVLTSNFEKNLRITPGK